MTTSLTANWNYPTSIRIGRGRVSELPAVCAEFEIRTPLLVANPGLAQLPMTADGVAAYRNGGRDGIIAFGGAA